MEPNEALRVSTDCTGEATAASRPVVLVVEDEMLLRVNAAEMIEQAGFDVIEAAYADDAIKILERRSDISIVFTDIQMPGSMDGLKLAHAVRDRWPPIRIITTSGRFALKPGELPDGSRFVPKPYSAELIASAPREMMPGA